MAAIHPSRMGLIQPQLRQSARLDSNDAGRPSSSSSLSPAPRDRYRPRTSSRSRSPRRESNRRRSPDYGEYERQPPPMYHPRGGRDYGNSSSGDWLEKRRLQREAASVSIWPPSPKEPARDDLSSKHSKKRSSKRARSSSSSSSSSSSEEDDRRRRKRRKEKKRSHKKSHTRRRSRSRSRSPTARHGDSEDEREYSRRHSKKKTMRRNRSRSPSRSQDRRPRSLSPRSPSERMDDDEWIEKPSAVDPSDAQNHHHHHHRYHKGDHQHTGASPPPRSPSAEAEEEDEALGPQPAAPTKARKVDDRAYGTSLLRGEGSAMAAFLQGESGTDARIPRRGEIGLTSDQIAQYENVGYVMSGSRHHRMNAVRMRKENQVISAEEKRSMLKLQKEEKERREAILREEFSDLVSENLKKGGKRESKAT